MDKVKLKDVATIEAGQGAPQDKQVFGKNGHPFIRAGHLEGLINGKQHIDQMENIDDENAKKYKLKLFKKGTILFAKSGMSCMKGWVYVIPKDCYVVSHLACVYSTKFSNRFLKYYFSYERPNKLIMDESYPSISLSSIGELLIPNYDLPTQQKIVEELDCLSDIIEKKKKQLSDFDELIKSKFVEMFGDPLINDKKFKTKSLSVACPFNKFKGVVDSVDDKYWILNLDMIESNTGRIIEKVYQPLNEIGNSTISFDTECILYSKLRPYLNKVAIPDTTGYATSELISMKTGNEINKYYLAYLLRNESFVTYINSKTTGAKMPRASMDYLRDFPLMIPEIAMQNEFAEFVKLIDKSKVKLQQSIEETQNLFNERMQHHFGE